MIINKILKGDCEVTQMNGKVKYSYRIFNDLSVSVVFDADKKSLKLSIKGKSFNRQLMYIIFN